MKFLIVLCVFLAVAQVKSGSSEEDCYGVQCQGNQRPRYFKEGIKGRPVCLCDCLNIAYRSDCMGRSGSSWSDIDCNCTDFSKPVIDALSGPLIDAGSQGLAAFIANLPALLGLIPLLTSILNIIPGSLANNTLNNTNSTG
jgi:hypothetical protein